MMLNLNQKKMKKTEYALKNYLNKHGIYKDNSDMQTIIINSFYCERAKSNSPNKDDWNVKLNYVNNHFGLFCQYAQNNWK